MKVEDLSFPDIKITDARRAKADPALGGTVVQFVFHFFGEAPEDEVQRVAVFNVLTDIEMGEDFTVLMLVSVTTKVTREPEPITPALRKQLMEAGLHYARHQMPRGIA